MTQEELQDAYIQLSARYSKRVDELLTTLELLDSLRNKHDQLHADYDELMNKYLMGKA